MNKTKPILCCRYPGQIVRSSTIYCARFAWPLPIWSPTQVDTLIATGKYHVKARIFGQRIFQPDLELVTKQFGVMLGVGGQG